MSEPGRVLALDIGSKRIGMALSDAMRIIAQPIGFLQRTGFEHDLASLFATIDEYQITELVVGLPKRLDGSHGDMANEAKQFANAVKEQKKIRIKMWDERFSTHAAERALLEGNVRRSKRKEKIDQTAAVWILQGYLDQCSRQ